MKKILLVFLLLISISNFCYADNLKEELSFGFNNIKWGSSWTDVKKIFPDANGMLNFALIVPIKNAHGIEFSYKGRLKPTMLFDVNNGEKFFQFTSSVKTPNNLKNRLSKLFGQPKIGANKENSNGNGNLHWKPSKDVVIVLNKTGDIFSVINLKYKL